MNIPEDVLHNDVILKIIGNKEVIIENYKGIHLYTEDEIVIACKKVILKISGNDLHVNYFSGCDMKITGLIESISYSMNGEL